MDMIYKTLFDFTGIVEKEKTEYVYIINANKLVSEFIHGNIFNDFYKLEFFIRCSIPKYIDFLKNNNVNCYDQFDISVFQKDKALLQAYSKGKWKDTKNYYWVDYDTTVLNGNMFNRERQVYNKFKKLVEIKTK